MTGSGDNLLYVYAVVAAAPEELGLGLDEAPLRAVTCGRVAAVVSEHERAPDPEEKVLWRHEEVLERLLVNDAVLPMRFGATVADAKELKAFLRSREEEFVESLAIVRGAVEIGVRADLPVPDPGREPAGDGAIETSGTEYMRARGRALRSVEQAKERLHGPLKELSRRSLVLEARGARGWDGAFRGAYLVDGERVEAFASRVDGLGKELGAEVSCTGPWPPYSFVAGAGR